MIEVEDESRDIILREKQSQKICNIILIEI